MGGDQSVGEKVVLRERHRLDQPLEPAPRPESTKTKGLESVSTGAVEGALGPLQAACRTSNVPLHNGGSLSR